MLPPRESSRKIVLSVIATLILLLTSLVAVLYLKPTVLEASPTQAVGDDSGVRQAMMQSSGVTKSTMSMAEMGAMMDEMMLWMNSMAATMSITGTAAMSSASPVSGTMSMVEMGHMMQMMGMMHQKMGQMQMMMGAMMSGGMMCNGMIYNGMMYNGMMYNGMMYNGMMNSDPMEGVEKLWHMHGNHPSE